MKENTISLAITLAIYSAVILGVPFALGVEIKPYWNNVGDLLLFPILIYYIFSKNGLYSILKDTHQFNKEQAENNEEQETYLFDSTKLLHFFRKNTINKS